VVFGLSATGRYSEWGALEIRGREGAAKTGFEITRLSGKGESGDRNGSCLGKILSESLDALYFVQDLGCQVVFPTMGTCIYLDVFNDEQVFSFSVAPCHQFWCARLLFRKCRIP